ncbi:MAG: chromate efflux transporter [Actinomycetes bacterium]
MANADPEPDEQPPSGTPPRPPRGRVGEVARLFTLLGFIGFGGPAAHIAMMREEVVRKRGWETDQDFLDLVGACSLVPGPNSTELAVHIGLRRAGWGGFVVAACGFILPAVAIVLVIAWAYDRYGATPTALDLSYGIVPVIVAVVAQAVWTLGRTAVKDVALGLVTVMSCLAWLAGVNELLVLVAAASFCAIRLQSRNVLTALVFVPLAEQAPHVGDAELWRLGAVFLKIGAVLYGSGYVLVSFLERDLVQDLGWLTERQLLDAVAVGQFTPGPVFTTATFVGYQILGVPGAIVATLAIFAPAFVFVALLGWITPRIRRSPTAGAALDGVNAASLGLMAGAAIRLADAAIVDPLTAAIAAVALAVLLWKRPNSAWLVAGGAAIGIAHGALT